MTLAVAVEGLQVVFGSGKRRVAAVEAVSFTAAAGAAFGIVGESGSGKSTVLRALSGLVPVTAGRILLHGEPLNPRQRRRLSRQLQMVFQDPYGSLHPKQTVDRILTEPLIIHRIDDRDRRVRRALDDVGLAANLRYRYPHQLSGGQRQRVAIARALMLEPRLLLLDEPTSALDASVQAEVLNLLMSLRQERRLTYLLVSHDLAVVDWLCDELMVMQAGRVVEQLSRADLVVALKAPERLQPYTRQLLAAAAG